VSQETIDFGDGLGLVPARQHPNGGGWVACTASVSDSAYVGPNARVGGKAWVGDDARVVDEARVGDEAWVTGKALVGGKARVTGKALVTGKARAAITPVFISGLAYPVTITDHHMRIGYEQHTHDEWRGFDNAQIAEMDGATARRFWDANRDWLLAACDAHAARVPNEKEATNV
jgi:hypothetical protein